MDDDDLTALRSAALASLSSKPQADPKVHKDEEDLDALRTAALMTRKQNQIQVIQRPSKPPQRIPIPESLRNIPPPPLLVPPSARINVPPPIFSHPMINMWTRNNLINLTPAPASVRPPVHRQPIRNVQPLMTMRIPPPPARHIAPQRFLLVPKVRCEVSKPQPRKEAEPVVPLEQKIPDKFSRYDPDSSSDEDEDHAAAKKKDEDNDESDAESVASKKSFSSASDADEKVQEVHESNGDKNENKLIDEKTEQNAEVTSDPGTPVQDEPCEDDISIIGDNEDDDILSAIDNFLEDKPTKTEPKKVVRKNSDKREKPVKPRIPIVYDRSNSQESTMHKRPSKTIMPSAAGKVSEAGKSLAKKTEIPTFEKKAEISSKLTNTHNNPASSSASKSYSIAKSNKPMRVEPPHHDNAGDNKYLIPVVSKRQVPSPKRQRRDSDLDSVGTSDLSFISSEDDKEKSTQVKEKPKRPRTRSVSDEMEKRRNERLKRQARPSNHPGTSNVETQHRQKAPKPEAEQRNDLRKKLEDKGIRKKKIVETQPKPLNRNDDKDKTSSNAVPQPRTGVISLKSKKIRVNPPGMRGQGESKEYRGSLKNSDNNENRKILITASISRGTRAVQEANAETRTKIISSDTVHDQKSTRKDTKQKQDHGQRNLRTVVSSKSAVTPSVKSRPRLPSRDKNIEQKAKKPTGVARSPVRFNVQPSQTNSSSEKSSSSQSSSSESDNEVVFNEEEIFAFSNQDNADYDEVLGIITDDVEPAPKARRKSSSKRRQHKKSVKPEKATRRQLPRERDKDSMERKEDKRESKPLGGGEEMMNEQPTRVKISIHQRLGRQEPKHDAEYETKRQYDDAWSEVTSNDTLPRRKIIAKRKFPESNNSVESESTKTVENVKRRILVSKGTTSVKSRHRQRTNVKERLGNKEGSGIRKILSESPDRDSEHFQSDLQKARMSKVMMKRKNSGKKLGDGEVMLEKKIRRIKQQNGKILKRQMEIQIEKEKFG